MKLSKLSMASPNMPPLELCLIFSAKGEFTTAPDPQMNSTPSRSQALTIAQIIGCNSENARCSSNCYLNYWNIFFIDKFRLSLTSKILIEVFQNFPMFCLSCFTLIVSFKNSETAFIKTFCLILFAP